MAFFPGQRWISHTESQLGLGVVVSTENRRVEISFPASGETRTYAIDNAPVSRVIYKVGDTVFDHDDNQYLIEELLENAGLIIYRVSDSSGEITALTEMDLSSFVQFDAPQERLFSGQIDRPRAFKLRYETLNRQGRLAQSPAQGLLGARVAMLPHQIYIAAEVGRRHAPRVLLADEVGLGKTIEAGMIIHQQIVTGRASRVLIMVPDTLVHQWLVEMLRRFNLSFAVFDQSRCEALEEAGENPFDTEQLILCARSLICEHPERLHQALSASWDLLIVDEAHHLEWHADGASEAYSAVEALAQQAEGLLLLTATPEQLGIEGHFARLRLIDPARFSDLDRFREEESRYQPLNALLTRIREQDDWTQDSQIVDELGHYLESEDLEQCRNSTSPVDAFVGILLDRHGTGRVLFRNTRAAIKGFPGREVFPHPLPLPEDYRSASLTPEADQGSNWAAKDARVAWLTGFLKANRGEKVLVICARMETAVDLEEHLRLREGFRSADFHEQLSIIERDRAAAYFSDREDGAQVLVCSEIGSEGRNFQFAHKLVLFDLPENPDLLEQRIGRLDRIGQQHDIAIHVPYFEASAQEVLFNWYHQGIDQFRHTFPGGQNVLEARYSELQAALQNPDQDHTALIDATRAQTQTLRQALQEGRDALLELNSCRPETAAQEINHIQDTEAASELAEYMERLFDHFGVDHEFHSDHSLILRPGEHMTSTGFPMLPDDGTTVTFDRERALQREDMQFLSWEHPMVEGAMTMISASESGNTCIAKMKLKGLKPGTVLLESIFLLSSVAPPSLQLDRFLPPLPLRVLIDQDGRDLGEILKHEALNSLSEGLPKSTAIEVAKQQRPLITGMIENAAAKVQDKVQQLTDEARELASQTLDSEIARLQSLQRKNPAIREEEIQHLVELKTKSLQFVEQSQTKLDALRIIIIV